MTRPSIQDIDSIEDEAAERFAFFLSGEATEAELAEIDRWRTLRPSHEAAWAQLSAIWSSSALAANSPAIQRMRATALERTAPKSDSGRAEGWRPLALAASLFVVVGSLLWSTGELPWSGPGNGRQVAGTAQWSDAVKTDVGEIRPLRLADGSDVTMNTDSILRTALSETTRRVDLSRGEAFFKVAHDGRRPFIVGSGEISVTAVGTAFSVRNTGSAVIVTLTEGQVRIASDDGRNSILLTPGMRLRADATGFHATKVNAEQATSWTSGMIDFDRTSLASAVDEMNRYSNQRIVLVGEALPRQSISGLFPVGRQDRFVDMLTTARKARIVSRTDTEIRLAPP